MRYHFDVEDGDTHPDPAGATFENFEDVRREALNRALALLGNPPEKFWHEHPWKMTVSDNHRHVQFTLHFLAVNAPLTESYGRRITQIQG